MTSKPPPDERDHDAQANFRFYVEFDNIYWAVFTEVSGLQAETRLTPMEEGGNNGMTHQLPGPTRFGNITFKRGITRSNELFRWYMDIVAGTIKKRHISVVLYDPAGAALIRWNFLEAFPVRWIGPAFAADGQTAAIEGIEFAFSTLELE